MQDDVSQFMTTFKQWDGKELLSYPKPYTEDELNTYKLRLKLSIEETFELFQATMDKDVYDEKIKPILDNLNDIISSLTVEQMWIDPVAILDSLVDQDVVNLGFANLLGLPMSEAWVEVHRSNMSKLDANGQPVFREDGKVLKSELYSEPNLSDIFDTYAYEYSKD